MKVVLRGVLLATQDLLDLLLLVLLRLDHAVKVVLRGVLLRLDHAVKVVPLGLLLLDLLRLVLLVPLDLTAV